MHGIRPMTVVAFVMIRKVITMGKMKVVMIT